MRLSADGSVGGKALRVFRRLSRNNRKERNEMGATQARETVENPTLLAIREFLHSGRISNACATRVIELFQSIDDQDLLNEANPDIIALDRGALFVWQRGDRHVQMFCSASDEREDFIYTAVTENRRQVEREPIHLFDAVQLAAQLHWMQDSPRAA